MDKLSDAYSDTVVLTEDSKPQLNFSAEREFYFCERFLERQHRRSERER